VSAPIVVSNGDVLRTFEQLIDHEETPAAYLQRLSGFETSLSAAALYLGTDAKLELDVGFAHEMLVFDSWRIDDVYRRIMHAEPTSVTVTLPSKVDAALAPPGTDVVSIVSLAPYDLDPPWTVERATELQNGMIATAERVVPGLADHIALRIGAYPGTMERYTLNQRGAMYGWAQSPAQAVGYRLQNVTPVRGLYLAGHWSQPGGGVTICAVSGARVAQYLLEFERFDEMLTSLERLAPPAASNVGA
jgi:phytoene dehydrogenase-like protein